MRILHTSDWHIGKRLMDRDRLPEQIQALDHLVRICDEKGVDLVLVAGDVFDTYLPPAEAEEVFFRVVKALAGENRAVVIVSGNHDDGVRLASSAPFAEEEGVYLFGNRPFTFHSTERRRPVFVAEAGEHHVVVENCKGERVYINALPYPNEARLKEDKSEESFPEKMSRWIARGGEFYRGDMPYILLTHLFVAGGSTSRSERDIDLGGARAVPSSLLPKDAYTALGHLHKRQKAGDNAYYSGSLLQYSFDETPDKSVYLLETEGNSVKIVEQTPVEGGKQLVRLEANGFDEALALLPRYEGCFIELTLHLKEPLTSQETAALRAASEGLVSLNAVLSVAENAPSVSRINLGGEELFTLFCKAQTGEEPSAELKEAFLALFSEVV